MTGTRERRRGTACALACAAALAAPVSAATLDLTGPGKPFEPAGLDADAVVREVPWALVNPADSDSRYAPLPDWSAWRSTDGDVLEVVAEVEAGASNAVWLAFGPEDAPALRIGWEGGRWHVLGGGDALPALPADAAAPVAQGARSIAVALHVGGTLAACRSRTSVREGAGAWTPVPELDLLASGWVQDMQHPSAWDAVRLSLRGKYSALSVLRIRWSADATVLLVK